MSLEHVKELINIRRRFTLDLSSSLTERFSRSLILISALLFFILPGTSFAADVSGPSTSSTGSYTITWTPCPANPGLSNVYENDVLIASLSYCSTSKPISGKASGTYIYKVDNCSELNVLDNISYICETLIEDTLPRHTVTVSLAPPPSTPGAISGPSSASYEFAGASYTLSWGASSGTVTAYELQEKVNTGSWVNIYSGTAISIALSGKTAATRYYRVRACNGGSNCSAYTANKSVVVTSSYTVTSPASSTTGSYTVSWTDPSGNNWFVLKQRKDGGAWGNVYSGSGTSAALSGRTNGAYDYQAEYCSRSYDGEIGQYIVICFQLSNISTTVVLQPPVVPSSITVPTTVDIDGAYTVSWASSSTATSYTLQESKDSGSYATVHNAAGTSKALSGRTAGSYVYRVRACNISGCSGWKTSTTVSVAIPSTPGAFTSPSGTQTTLSFTVDWGDSSYASNYQLQRRIKGTDGVWPAYSALATVAASSYAETVAGNGSYQYGVRACNDVGCSDYLYSGTFTVLLPPPTPGSIIVPTTTDIDGAYTISWASSSTATSYMLQEQINSGAWTTVYTGALTSSALSGKTNGSYVYRVRASNSSGVSSYRTSTSFSVLLPPPAPGSITVPVTIDIDGAYTVSWVASNTATSYTLQEQFNAGAWTTIHNAAGTSKVLSGKVDGSYSYRVNACNSSGCGSYRTSTLVIVLVAPTTPGALSGPATASYSDATLASYTLSWGASTGNVTAYNLEERINTTWETVYAGTATNTTLSSKAKGTYYYRVKACNGTSCSGYTAEKTVQVSEIRQLTAPVQDGDGSFTVSWTTPPGYNWYQLKQRKNGGAWGSPFYLGAGASASVVESSNGNYEYQVAYCTSSFDGSLNDYIVICIAFSNIAATEVLFPPATSATISAPATSATGTYTVSWSAVDTASTYTLHESKDGGAWVTVQNSDALSSAINGRGNGDYSYRVTACNWSGCGAYSVAKTVQVLHPPSAPVLSGPVTATTGSSYNLSWSAVDTATSYSVEESINGGAWGSQSYTTTSVLLSGINASYRYRAKACNASGCSFNYSAIHTVLFEPVVPVISGPSSSNSGGFVLTWSSSVNDPIVDTYTLNESTDGSTWFVVTPDNPTSIDITKPDGAYYYKVEARNSAGVKYSSVHSVSVLVQPTNNTPPLPATTSAPSAFEIQASDQVGSINGNFRVDESGSATYSIPIATAAGTAGVAPSIGLSYSSQGGNGLAGKGWAISGLSAISRCGQTKAIDGINKPLTWTADDRACLDGQRLVLYPATGTYWAHGSTYDLEISESFTKITYFTNSTGGYFSVINKDGSVSEYGLTTDARLTNSAGGVLTWAINKTSDSVGNDIQFSYLNDVNGLRIDKIGYAYGSGTVTDTYVQFSYGERDDDINGYVAGYAFGTTKKLTGITSFNDGTAIRDYILTYEDTFPDVVSYPTKQLSRIIQIEECAFTVCLPATTFDWHDPSMAYSLPVSQGYELGGSDAQVIDYRSADINGDGNLDLVFLGAYVSGGGTTVYFIRYMLSDGKMLRTTLFNDIDTGLIQLNYVDLTAKFEIIDYNADGRQDLIVHDSSDNFWKVHLSIPKGDGVWVLSSSSIPTPISGKEVKFFDQDGDGLIDALRVPGYSNDPVTQYMLKVDESLAETSNARYRFVDSGFLYESVLGSVREILPVELNGDGRVDFLVREVFDPGCITEGGGTCGSTETYFNFGYVQVGENELASANVPDFQVNEAGLSEFNVPGDLNADGLTDFVYYNDGWKYSLNMGGAWTTPVNIPDIASGDEIQMVDYNLDGYPDVISGKKANTTWKLHYWNPETNSLSAVSVSMNASLANSSLSFFDINGDGVRDKVEISPVEIKLFESTELDSVIVNYPSSYASLLTNFNTARPPHVITDITNGIGQHTEIVYESLSDTDHYERINVGNQYNTYEFDLPGGKTYSFSILNIGDFYAALNGGWDLPIDAHTFGKDQPVLELNAPVFVVTNVGSTAPKSTALRGNVDAAALSRISYYYGEAKIQAAGRGFLGFEKLKTVDDQTGISTITTYRQDFPFIGRPWKTEVYSPANALLSRSVSHHQINDWSGNNEILPTAPFRPHVVENSTITNDLTTGSLLSTVTTSSLYDNYGNAMSVNVLTQGGDAEYTLLTENDFGVSENDLQYGRLKSTKATHRRPGTADIVRQSNFTYYPSGTAMNLLWTEAIQRVIDGVSTGDELVTTYSYGIFGNVIRKETIGNLSDNNALGEHARFTRTEYDADGRYVTKTFASNGITEYVTSHMPVSARNSLGLPTIIYDTNDVKTDIVYGAFGGTVFKHVDTGSYSQTLLSSDVVGCPTGSSYKAVSKVVGGGESFSCHDAVARLTKKATKNFDGTGWYVSLSEYDELGRPKHQSAPFSEGIESPQWKWTTMTYDILGRVIQVDGPTGTVTNSFTNYTTTLTNQLGQTKTETTNSLGELIRVEDAGSGSISYTYDATGNVLTTTTSSGADLVGAITVTMTYDTLGRKQTMDDPDKGYWQYFYNAFGGMTKQINGDGDASEWQFDVLGRMVNRKDYDGSSIAAETTWVYDQASRVNLYGVNVGTAWGKVSSVTHITTVFGKNEVYSKYFTYDDFGRASSIQRFIDVDEFNERFTYDQYGRSFQHFDASAGDRGTENIYNDSGYLFEVREAAIISGAQKSYYTTQEVDARGNITEELLGNGLTTQRVYDPVTGFLNRIQTTSTLGVYTPQDLMIEYNQLGIVTSRKNVRQNKTEYFCYDDGPTGLNRLIASRIDASCAGLADQNYDDYGNIKHKVGVGDYNYNSGRPHAVTSAGSTTYTYDGGSATGNGNMTSDTSGRAISYTSFDKPYSMTKGADSTKFWYGPDRARYKRVDAGADNATTLYVGNVEIITRGSVTETKRYIGGRVLITNQTDVHYLLKDHLGSIVAIVGEDITTPDEQLFSYDAWGLRRDAVDMATLIAQSTVLNITQTFTTRGFTGHEMVDAMGIIHMNGRIYDPLLGRFLSADPIIQFPSNTQSYNRYSYVLNSPLSYTDPSGYSYKWFMKKSGIWNTHRALSKFPVLTDVIQAVLNYFVPLIGIAFSYDRAYYASRDHQTAANSSGISYLMSSLASEMGADGITLPEGLALGVAGGIASELQGGRFGHGFVSSGVGSYVGGRIGGAKAASPGAHALKSVGRIVLAGTISKATGGKFANGAASAAFAAIVVRVIAGAQEVKAGSKPNITGSDKIAYVGGAGDNTYGAGIVKVKFDAYITANGNGSAKYFEWTDADALSVYIDDNNGRVTIVAHSYGADVAAHLVADGMEVYKLVTVDPVGWTRPSMQAISNNSVIWNNFDSTGASGSFWNNMIATIGGAWNSRPSGYATSHRTSDLGHVAICGAYCKP